MSLAAILIALFVLLIGFKIAKGILKLALILLLFALLFGGYMAQQNGTLSLPEATSL